MIQTMTNELRRINGNTLVIAINKLSLVFLTELYTFTMLSIKERGRVRSLE